MTTAVSERRFFVVHINPDSERYGYNIDPTDPYAWADALKKRRAYTWLANTLWNRMRVGDVALFKHGGKKVVHPQGIYSAGRIVRGAAVDSDGSRRFRFVGDASLTAKLRRRPILVDRLRELVPASFGSPIQEVKEPNRFRDMVGQERLPEITATDEARLTKRSVTLVRRLARDSAFARSVRQRGPARCAACPARLQYDEVPILEVAHVRSVAARGPDELSNALVLCPTHHALFDEGFWTINAKGAIEFSAAMPERLRATFPRTLNCPWRLGASYLDWHRREVFLG